MHIAKRTNKSSIMNLLLQNGAKPLDDMKKSTKFAPRKASGDPDVQSPQFPNKKQ